MQSINNIQLKFILISEHISFIPDNILNNCQVINIPRPSITYYKKCIKNTTNHEIKKNNLSTITNIKNITANITQLKNPYENICNSILHNIRKPQEITFLTFRDILYDILIYDLDIGDCIWYIITTLIDEKLLKQEDISDILLKTYTFLQYYNNNYRPIYHLENYMYNLISTVHGYKKCT